MGNTTFNHIKEILGFDSNHSEQKEIIHLMSKISEIKINDDLDEQNNMDQENKF